LEEAEKAVSSFSRRENAGKNSQDRTSGRGGGSKGEGNGPRGKRISTPRGDPGVKMGKRVRNSYKSKGGLEIETPNSGRRSMELFERGGVKFFAKGGRGVTE